MYSHCIHCQQDLGRNDLIETLPVGRRIAFDAATGRLWVICGACARWNLVPFESRWEAIETGEQLYRGATQRMSTGEIGLAKTREGTDLVRVGRALRPEMAAWRYGSGLVQRRWTYARTVLPVTALVTLTQLLPVLNEWSGIVAVSGMGVMYLSMYAHHRYVQGRTQSRLLTGTEITNVTRYMVQQIAVNPRDDGSLQLWLPIMPKRVEDDTFFGGIQNVFRMLPNARRSRDSLPLSGVVLPSHFTRVDPVDEGRVLRHVLPLLHEAGARARDVRESLSYLDQGAGDFRTLLFGGRSDWNVEATALRLIHRPRRLALEMLVHEDSERRWLAGELLDLEAEWRRADEIASIADAILRDPAIEAKLGALRDGACASDTNSD